MATLEQIAPNLAQVLNETQALALADLPEPPAAKPPKTLAQLSPDERTMFRLWLKWRGFPYPPLNVASIARMSPRDIARATGLEHTFCRTLLQEVAAIRAAVAANPDDPFAPSPE